MYALFNVDGRATATGGRLARKRLLDNKRAPRATDGGVAGKNAGRCDSERVNMEMYPRVKSGKLKFQC